MTASPIPEPDAIERAARLAAEAALADTSAAMADLLALLGAAREENLRNGRLLANFAGQLDTLQAGLDAEREARIAAIADTRERVTGQLAGQLDTLQAGLDAEREARDAAIADTRERVTADLKLALMERAR